MALLIEMIQQVGKPLKDFWIGGNDKTRHVKIYLLIIAVKKENLRRTGIKNLLVQVSFSNIQIRREQGLKFQSCYCLNWNLGSSKPVHFFLVCIGNIRFLLFCLHPEGGAGSSDQECEDFLKRSCSRESPQRECRSGRRGSRWWSRFLASSLRNNVRHKKVRMFLAVQGSSIGDLVNDWLLFWFQSHLSTVELS